MGLKGRKNIFILYGTLEILRSNLAACLKLRLFRAVA